ncbi:MAG: hypothetical protein A3B74_03495 [Candidatus Kerfeldbacteria bacterium RIFCSPHIGHO2_02_FULL_42_14]|uniref:2'-5' RNA ligase n=1 Tax=Candidatus Kerfeldbacteria bacterium RIFCSPHIGHO2_02_FULL_42_14 TaxID=1798540 RepID=A0A1G2ASD3_9BACT|nr:MAG: hypothetical protein A3B74_03495 [Candidatus Kerfeldbacteria bacterium RIFCSPHIGHO2_02_FULL_42_14]OGY80580.1 MAG: hypothetical protein A3E60_03985 [Candidatus Kerfeldbacteria bacterium RIFCSPHIGHO2_12_FULL_42_13]OGY87566.1 MAG: hypothetical protein A3G01_00915 [Candidatus Kerfeldbacteria bacterium RIFCSPLOWO2_12_FULL_43_9]
MSKNVSYITAEFFEKEKEKITRWSKSVIKDSDLCKILGNGKVGGYATDDLHLTLFYGFDEYRINIVDIQKWISTTTLKKIEIEKVGAFALPVQEYKIIYLAIRDKNGKIKKLHKELKNFPHFPKYRRSKFIPHITIAFVNKEFNEDAVIYNGPKILNVRKIVYHTKGKLS